MFCTFNFMETFSGKTKHTCLHSKAALSAALCGTPRALPSGARRGRHRTINPARPRANKVGGNTKSNARIAQRRHCAAPVCYADKKIRADKMICLLCKPASSAALCGTARTAPYNKPSSTACQQGKRQH